MSQNDNEEFYFLEVFFLFWGVGDGMIIKCTGNIEL